MQATSSQSGGGLIGNQIFRSGTSIAANYRAACRARSRAEFLARLAVVEEEADETLFWLEILKEMTIAQNALVESLVGEAHQITAIIVASIKTTRDRMPVKNLKIRKQAIRNLQIAIQNPKSKIQNKNEGFW